MTRYAQEERQALCDTFEQVGPDAPTLSAPWATRDLAAHLVLRERRPDAAVGIMAPAKLLVERAQRVQDSYAAREWPLLVDLVRSGPPAWMPTAFGPIDELANTAEFFVHHEDVLRAASAARPLGAAAPAGPAPRPLSPGLEDSLWANLSRMGRLLYRRAPVGIELAAPGRDRRRVHGTGGRGSVLLHGAPGELLLHAFGRGRVARIEVEGSDDAIAALASTHVGL